MTLPLTRINNWISGELALAADLQDLASWTRMKDSIVAYAVTGSNAWLPAFNVGGIDCVPGTGLQVLLQPVGSLNSCRIFLPHRSNDGTWTSTNPGDGGLAQAAYYTPPTSPTDGYAITIAAPPGSGTPYRTDLIAVQFSAVPVNPQMRAVRSGTVVSNQECSQIDDTIAFNYVIGTPSTTFPAPTPTVPTGWDALYTVYVANGDTSIGPSGIILVMPTFDQLIAGMSGAVLSTVPFPCPAVGASVNITTNGAQTINGGYYFILGPHDIHGFVAVQTAGEGTNISTMQCVAVLFGTIGTNVDVGAIIAPIAQPRLVFQDGSLAEHSVIEQSGEALDPGAGMTVPVTFATAYTSKDNYRILGLTPLGADWADQAPFVIMKAADGFTISMPSVGHGNVEWGVEGRINP